MVHLIISKKSFGMFTQSLNHYNIKPNSFVLVSCSLTLTFIVKQGGRYSAEVLRQ